LVGAKVVNRGTEQMTLNVFYRNSRFKEHPAAQPPPASASTRVAPSVSSSWPGPSSGPWAGVARN